MNRFVILLAVLLLPLVAFAEDDVVWTTSLPSIGNVERIDFVLNNQFLLAQNTYGYLYLLDANNGEIIKNFGGFGWYKPSENGHSFYIAGGFSIYTYDIESGKANDSIVVKTTDEYFYYNGDKDYPFESSYLTGIILIPNSDYIFAGWYARGIINHNSQEIINIYNLLLVDKNSGIIERKFDFSNSSAFKFSPDGKYFAIGYNNGDVELWDAKTFEKKGKLFTIDGNVNCFDFNSNSNMLAVGAEADEKIYVWDINSNSLKYTLLNDEISSSIKSISFMKNDLYLVTGGGAEDYAVKIWDLAIQKKIYSYPQKGFIHDVKPTSNNNTILSGAGRYAVLYKVNYTSVNETKPDKILEIHNDTMSKIVKVSAEINSKIRIYITDIKGKIIEELFNGSLQNDEIQIPFPMDKYGKGVYFIVLQNGQKIKSVKVVKG